MLAIHKGKNTFFEEWVTYCAQHAIPYIVVDSRSSDFIEKLKGCKALLWHHQHSLPHDLLVAKQIMYAAEVAGVVVFPSFVDNWHFDDKLGQHYLLQFLNIKTPQTWVYYSYQDFLNESSTLTYPVVFKLRNGAGSRNVKLIETNSALKRLAYRIFTKGIRQYDSIGGVKEAYRKWRLGKSTLKDIIKALAHIVYPLSIERVHEKAWGYLYLQEYIKSDADYRVIVIGEKAFAIKRLVRVNDFRASGSGFILYDKKLFPDSLIAQAFDIAAHLKSESIAFDFIRRAEEWILLEVSYGWNKHGYRACQGYWDKQLTWHEGKIDPYGWMVELVCKKAKLKT